MARIIFGVFLVLLGVSALTGLSLFKFFFSLLIIFWGIKLIAGPDNNWFNFDKDNVPENNDKPREDQDKIQVGEVIEELNNEDRVSEVIIFSQIKRKIDSQNFKGGRVVVVFGSGQIDLSQAKAAGREVKFEFTTVFGSGKLILPKNWQVEKETTSVIGSYSNSAIGSSEVKLKIKGAAVFGDVDIKN